MKKFLLLFLSLVIIPFSLFGLEDMVAKKHRKRPIQKAAIYDCFMFFNELELLEIRLNELYPYVDKFVLVEACETHRKAELKPFYYELNKERYAQFADKIIHIKLEEHYETSDSWARENWHRNQIMRGLTDCKPNDIILISDVDEIVPGIIIPQLDHELNKYKSIVCIQNMYRWFLNRSCNCVWGGTGIVRFKDLININPQGVRVAARTGNMGKQWHVGWHFTSMGGYDKIMEKYRGIVEGYDYAISEEGWRAQANSHIFVPIDESYPKFIQDNIDYLIDLQMIDIDPTQT